MGLPVTQYFLDHHYATFNPPKPDLDDDPTQRERLNVREALLGIDLQLWPFIQSQGWDLHRHHMSQHYVSSDHFLYYDDGRPLVNKIESMWLHYGKSKDQLDGLRTLGRSYDRYNLDEYYNAFYLHTRIQIYINQNVVRCWLIFTDKNYYDRKEFAKALLFNQGFRDLYWDILQTLLGKGFFYVIGSDHLDLDTQVDKDIVLNFIKKDRKDGVYSGIVKEYPKDDPRISRSNIFQEMQDNFTLLYPLYEKMSIRTIIPKKSTPKDLSKLFGGNVSFKK